MNGAAHRSETFRVRGGFLVRDVVPAPRYGNHAPSRPYSHRCSLATFEEVAHAIDGRPYGVDGATTAELWGELGNEGHAATQISTAIAFLKERGVIEVDGRRFYPTEPGGCHLASMLEWHALADGGAS